MHPKRKKRKKNELKDILEEISKLNETCVLCHDSICDKEVYKLPCDHSFHKECFKNQLKSNKKWSNKCALCRIDITDKIKNNKELNMILKQNPPLNISDDELEFEEERETQIEEQNIISFQESDLEYLTVDNEYWEYCENLNSWFNETNEENTILVLNDNESTSSSNSIPDLTDNITSNAGDDDGDDIQ